MPLQILGQEQDPSVQAIQQGVQGISGALQQQQEQLTNIAKIQIAIKQLDIDAKNTENLAEQNKITAKKQFLEYAKFLSEKGIPEDLRLPALKQAAERFGLDFFGDGMSSLGQAMALGEDIEGKARKEARGKFSGMMEGIKGAPVSNAMTVEPNIGASPAITGASTASENNMRLKQISSSGPTFADPSYAYEETRMRERAKIEEELKPTLDAVGAYSDQFNLAVDEMGGLGESGLGAWVKGSAAGIYSNIGKMPNVQAFTRLKEAVSLTLASFMNRGRPTEPDRAAAEKLLEDIRYPARTNQALVNFRMKMFSSYGGSSLGPGNEYMAIMGKKLVDTAKTFVERAQKQGLSEEAINIVLDEYYKSLGY